MEFRVLQYFLTIAQEESISRAAEVLHLTQPTLSRQIAQLEEELGAPLFVRGRRTVLTEAGMMLRRKAEEVSFLMDAIKTDFLSRKDMSGEVRIGSGIYAGSTEFLRCIPGFMERYPNVKFDIYTATADLLKERLDHGMLDFAILQEPIDIGGYDFLRLPVRDEWGFLMAGDSPYAQKKGITKEDLPHLRIMTPRRAPIQGEFRNWLGDTTVELHGTGNMSGNMRPFVDAGYVWLTIRGSAEVFDPAKYAFVPLVPALVTTTVLAWKKIQPVFGPAGEFLSYVKSLRKENATDREQKKENL